MPDLALHPATLRQADRARAADQRRFRYLLVGAPTEEAAVEIGEGLQGHVPEGAHVGIRHTQGLTSPPSCSFRA